MKSESARKNEGGTTVMKRGRLWACLAVILVGALGFVAAKGKSGTSTVPATATFGDRQGDRILSDGGGDYVNGVGCVNSTVVNSSGHYLLRTIRINPDGTICTGQRHVVLDFTELIPGTGTGTGGTCAGSVSDPTSDPSTTTLTLNTCGLNSVIPDVRLQDDMFSQGALTTGVSLLFSLDSDFHDTDFALDFQQPLPVTGIGTTRTVTATSTSTAELYQFVSVNGKLIKSSLGIYYMPFELTVAEQ